MDSSGDAAAVVTVVTDSIGIGASTSIEDATHSGSHGFISAAELEGERNDQASKHIPISTEVEGQRIPTLSYRQEHIQEYIQEHVQEHIQEHVQEHVQEHAPVLDEIQPAPSFSVSDVMPPPVPQDPLLAILASIQQQLAALQNSEEEKKAATTTRPPPPPPRRSRFLGWSKSMKAMKESDIHLGKGDFKIPNVDINMEGYFVGPRDLETHSKWPNFMQLHGSITPRMLLPMLMITLWSIIVTAISAKTKPLGVSNILLTILGFVVGLSLSFRGSTAYERYMEGRKCWASILVQSRNLARYIWVHIQERPGEQGKEDLMAKISAINLIHAFAVATKHRLRFEPYTYYADLDSLVGHLDTFAKAADHPGLHEAPSKKKNRWKAIGEYLGLNMAASNPRKALKRAIKPVGNLPYEILLDISAYMEMVINNGTMTSTIIYGQVLNALAAITDVVATADRVLATPLPIGYAVLISQIVALYVYLLPFQLFPTFGYNTIPATMAAAYIILGLEAMGNELENPFGNNVNDLPLDQYCDELRKDLDVVMSSYRAEGYFGELLKRGEERNRVLWPLSNSSARDWGMRDTVEIRAALRAKVVVGETRRLSIERDRDGEGGRPWSRRGEKMMV